MFLEWQFSHKCDNGLIINGCVKASKLVRNIMYSKGPMMAPKTCINAIVLALLMDRLHLNRACVPFFRRAAFIHDVEVIAIGYPKSIQTIPEVKDVLIGDVVQQCMMVSQVRDSLWFVQTSCSENSDYYFSYKLCDLHMVDVAKTSEVIHEQDIHSRSRESKLLNCSGIRLPESLDCINDDNGSMHRGLRDIFAFAHTKAAIERARLERVALDIATVCTAIELDPFVWPASHASWRRRMVVVWQELHSNGAVQWHTSFSTLPAMIKMCRGQKVADGRRR